jgi:hypothetical protein
LFALVVVGVCAYGVYRMVMLSAAV